MFSFGDDYDKPVALAISINKDANRLTCHIDPVWPILDDDIEATEGEIQYLIKTIFSATIRSRRVGDPSI
jgi:hypothetical protein